MRPLRWLTSGPFAYVEDPAVRPWRAGSHAEGDPRAAHHAQVIRRVTDHVCVSEAAVMNSVGLRDRATITTRSTQETRIGCTACIVLAPLLRDPGPAASHECVHALGALTLPFLSSTHTLTSGGARERVRVDQAV